LSSGLQAKTLKWGKDKIEFLAFSRDGEILGEDGADGVARVWHWKSDTPPLEIHHSTLIPWIAISPDGGRAAFIDEYRILTVVDTSSGKVIAQLNRDSAVNVNEGPVVFSPDGLSIAISSDKAATRVWTLIRPGSTEKRPVFANPKSVDLETSTCLAYSPSGKYLLEAGVEKEKVGRKAGIEIWDVTNGRRSALVVTPNVAPCIALSPDGKQLAVSSSRVGIWNVSTLSHANHNLTGRFMSPNVFSPDSKYFTAYQRTEVDLYDAHTWKQIRSFKK
jgi:WD40 repeat protein